MMRFFSQSSQGSQPSQHQSSIVPHQSSIVPLMFQIYQNLLVSPSLPETWSLALLNPIPITAGLPSAQDLRPLVLQNFNNKWVASIVSL